MEDEEEAEMERANIANDMTRRTKAVETFQKLLNDVARDWRTKGSACHFFSIQQFRLWLY